MKAHAAGFADQKGSAHGFGPSGNSESPTLLAELSLGKLYQFHMHSKSIENAFGHLDNLLKQSGPQGFEKVVQSMQISSAKDLVFDGKYEWRKMPVQKRKQMKDIQMQWNNQQQNLLNNGVKN